MRASRHGRYVHSNHVSTARHPVVLSLTVAAGTARASRVFRSQKTPTYSRTRRGQGDVAVVVPSDPGRHSVTSRRSVLAVWSRTRRQDSVAVAVAPPSMRRLFPAVPSSDPDVHGPRPLPPILVKRHACHKRDAPRNASSTPACTRTRQQPALFHCASSRISCKIKNRGNLRYAANLDV